MSCMHGLFTAVNIKVELSLINLFLSTLRVLVITSLSFVSTALMHTCTRDTLTYLGMQYTVQMSILNVESLHQKTD